jgi:hypothetical protein
MTPTVLAVSLGVNGLKLKFKSRQERKVYLVAIRGIKVQISKLLFFYIYSV